MTLHNTYGAKVKPNKNNHTGFPDQWVLQLVAAVTACNL